MNVNDAAAVLGRSDRSDGQRATARLGSPGRGAANRWFETPRASHHPACQPSRSRASMTGGPPSEQTMPLPGGVSGWC